MILSENRITKVLIRLHRCTGWYVPLIFANPEDWFSRLKAYLRLILVRKYCCSVLCLHTFIAIGQFSLLFLSQILFLFYFFAYKLLIRIRILLYGKCSKISNTFLSLFSNKMLVIRVGINKMLVCQK